MALSLLLAGLLVLAGTMLTHGLGLGVERLLRLPANRWAMTAATGLAALIFLGGIVNLLGLAFRWTLLSITVIGVVADLAWWIGGGWCRQYAAIRAYGAFNAALATLAIVAFVGFAAATQFPAAAYNFHDDFEKYFAFPVRMLATGTLAGDPLSALGVETLGGQSYLQGFVLSLLPIGYINGVDAVLCLALSLIMAASMAPSRRWLPAGALAVLVVAFINPQYVNVSSIYSGVFLMMGAMVWAVEAPRRQIGTWRDGAVMALILAAMIALKSSHGLFCVLLVALVAVGRLVVERRLAITAKWLLAVGLGAGLFIAPWLFLYADSIAFALQQHGAGTMIPSADVDIDFFSDERLPYGSSFLLYTATVLGGLALVGLQLARWRQADTAERRAMVALVAGGAAAAAAYFMIVLVLGTWHSAYPTALRYTLAGIIALAGLALANSARPGSVGRAGRIVSTFAALVFVGLVLLGFLPSAVSRTAQAIEFHNILAFSWVVGQPDFIAHNEHLLASDGARPALAAQAAVPPGVAIVVWTESPFLFDYARNPIYEVQPAGLASPWAHVPEARYVIWQYSGYGVRSTDDYREDIENSGAYERLIAVHSLNFARMLDQSARRGRILYNDGSMVAFKLAAPLSDDWRSVALPQ